MICVPRELPAAEASPFGLEIIRTTVTPNWENGGSLFVEQLGRFVSRDLGCLRGAVSLNVTSGAASKQTRVRAGLFSPAGLEWKELVSYGPSGFRLWSELTEQLAFSPEKVLASCDVKLRADRAPDSLVSDLFSARIGSGIAAALAKGEPGAMALVQDELSEAWRVLTGLFS